VISHGDRFVIRHASGRYLQWRTHFPTIKRVDGSDSGCHDPSQPSALFFLLVESPLHGSKVSEASHWQKFIENDASWAAVADQFEVRPAPGCNCCGERHFSMHLEGEIARCEKHRGRNPCAVEGCRRTCAADGRLANDQFLCSEHWRRFVPPRSPTRRAYHRFFQLAKKRGGWDRPLERRFRRFWRALINRARSQHENGRIDVAEINQLFGWDE